jgi:hypothetical protein
VLLAVMHQNILIARLLYLFAMPVPIIVQSVQLDLVLALNVTEYTS